MKKFKESSIVYSKFELSGIPKDTKGVVVLVYPDAHAYEVEFIVNGELEVKTVMKDQIYEKVK